MLWFYGSAKLKRRKHIFLIIHSINGSLLVIHPQLMKSTDLNVHLSPDRCYLAPIFSNISPLFLDTGNNFSLRYCDSVPNNHQGNWRNRLLAGEMSRHARQDTTQPWFDVYLTILPHFHRGQSLNLIFLSSLRPYLASFGKFYVGDNF